MNIGNKNQKPLSVIGVKNHGFVASIGNKMHGAYAPKSSHSVSVNNMHGIHNESNSASQQREPVTSQQYKPPAPKLANIEKPKKANYAAGEKRFV